MARLILKRYMGVKGAEANVGKGNLSYSLVNAIGSNNLRAVRRPNKGKNTIIIFLRIGIIGLKDWLY